MLQNINKYNILFLDIETVSVKGKYKNLDKDLQKLWQKKHATLYRNEDIAFDKGFEQKAAIYAEFGKIVCISCGFLTNEDGKDNLRIKSFYSDNEKELLEEFAELLRNNYSDFNNQTICGHNIKEFDIPYLCRRMLINGIKLPSIIDIHGKKPWEVNFIDTLQLWKFGDYKAYTSLNLLAHLFKIPTPKDDIDGSMVSAVYWQEKNLERIRIYCQKDVVTVVRLYQRFINEDFVLDDAVFVVE